VKPKLLDLFCGAGGAAMGLHRAGFDVTGVDNKPQPRYPFPFILADAMEVGLEGYDCYWASPPCQGYTVLFPNALHRKEYNHPDLVAPTRERLILTGKPYVMENVPNSPLRAITILCGAMFGLRVYRHRLFEASFLSWQPHHPKHLVRTAGKGYAPKDDKTFWTITGSVGGLRGAQEAMGIDWMQRDAKAISQAIPPAYSEYLGQWMMEALKGQA